MLGLGTRTSRHLPRRLVVPEFPTEPPTKTLEES